MNRKLPKKEKAMNHQYPKLPRIDHQVAMYAWQHMEEMHHLADQTRMARLARADRMAMPAYLLTQARRLWKLLRSRGGATADQALPIPETY